MCECYFVGIFVLCDSIRRVVGGCLISTPVNLLTLHYYIKKCHRECMTTAHSTRAGNCAAFVL